jgi:O-antigen/teichoic acid export membrane protein
VLVMMGWPITVGIFMLTPGLNRLLQLYPQSEAALRILALGIVFMFANNAFIGALSATDRQALFTWTAFASMVVNVILNFALIPTFGYLGASWATVLTEVSLLSIGWVMLARSLHAVPFWRLSWRVLLAGLVMGAALFPVRDLEGWPVLLAVALGASVYAVAVFLLRVVDREEIELARAALALR